MANKSLFKSTRGRTVPETDAVNAAGGAAYSSSPKEALARYAATGCLSNTYYVKDTDHLDRVLKLAAKCGPEYIAKLAIFARKQGFMKDMPAFLMAHLSTRGEKGVMNMKAAFPHVIDNGVMLTNFVQIMRSGAVGRRSLGTAPRNLCRTWLTSHDPEWVFRQLAVQHGGLKAKDVISMVRPNGAAASKEHDALFGYWLGKVYPRSAGKKWPNVPQIVKEFEKWKANRDLPPPRLDFRLLDSDKLTGEQWAKIMRQQGWHAVKNNINTAIRNGALKADPGLEKHMADLIRNPQVIRKVRVMPSQLLAAYRHTDSAIPRSIVEALHDAMEEAVLNVPIIEGDTMIIIDISSSMGWNATDSRSKMRYVDIAALFTAAITRQNRNVKVIPVNTQPYDYRPEPRNTVLSEAERLAKMCSGGTALAAGFRWANQNKARFKNAIVISDNESWADRAMGYGYSFPYGSGTGTAMMEEWEQLRSRSGGQSKLVCIDIAPGITRQSIEGRSDILHVSGWNDTVFRVVEAFLRGDAGSYVEVVEGIRLEYN